MATATAQVTPEPPKVDDDPFAMMFADLTAPEPKTPAVGETPPAPKPVETPTPVEGATPPAPVPGETELEPPDEEGGETPPEPKPPVDDPFARLADLITERNKAAPAPALAPAPVPQSAPAALYSEAETAALKSFYDEWPDVAKAQELMLRGLAHQVTNHIFGQISATIGPKLAMLEELATARQVDDLKAAVPDYSDELVDKVTKWVDTQPSYLKTAYTRVIQEGTADEVTDLVSRYKAATGTSVAPAGTPPVAAPKTPVVVPKPVNKAIEALAPINTKRSGAPASEPVDFDSAFAAFAKSV